MVAPSVPVATLIYDGECAMCRASALWLMRRAMDGGALEILPCRSAPRRHRFPHLTDEQCMTAMQLVLPDGRVLASVTDDVRTAQALRPWPRRLFFFDHSHAEVVSDGVRQARCGRGPDDPDRRAEEPASRTRSAGARILVRRAARIRDDAGVHGLA